MLNVILLVLTGILVLLAVATFIVYGICYFIDKKYVPYGRIFLRLSEISESYYEDATKLKYILGD